MAVENMSPQQSSTAREIIKRAQANYAVAQKLQDQEGMQRAHQAAEAARGLGAAFGLDTPLREALNPVRRTTTGGAVYDPVADLWNIAISTPWSMRGPTLAERTTVANITGYDPVTGKLTPGTREMVAGITGYDPVTGKPTLAREQLTRAAAAAGGGGESAQTVNILDLYNELTDPTKPWDPQTEFLAGIAGLPVDELKERRKVNEQKAILDRAYINARALQASGVAVGDVNTALYLGYLQAKTGGDPYQMQQEDANMRGRSNMVQNWPVIDPADPAGNTIVEVPIKVNKKEIDKFFGQYTAPTAEPSVRQYKRLW